MPDTPADAFLSGQGIPVALTDVDSTLAQLWEPAAEQSDTGGNGKNDDSDDAQAVTRLVLANLVVADLGPDNAKIAARIETAVTRYPCRAIVLRPAGESSRNIQAEVSAICHLPAPGMPQVCAERIVLRAAAGALDLIPSAVRSLLVTDLPMVLWWIGDPRPTLGLFHELSSESSRMILDLPDPTADPGALWTALDLGLNRYGRDIAWFGITPWRELVAQFFDPPGAAELLHAIKAVRIESVSPTSGHLPRVAAWLTGWLAGQLHWQPDSRDVPSLDTLVARFNSPHGPVTVTLQTRVDASVELPHITAVELNAEGPNDLHARWLLERGDHGRADGVNAECHTPGHCPLPRVVHAPEWNSARRVAASLESDRDDPPYRHALSPTLWLLAEE